MTTAKAGIRLAPITALLLLLGIIATPAGIHPTRAQPQRLTAARSIAAQPNLRTPRRATIAATTALSDQRIADASSPRIVTQHLWSHPLPTPADPAATPGRSDPQSPYNARAPPAA